MRTTAINPIGALGAAMIVLALGGWAQAYSGERLAGDAKVGIAQARAIALKAHPGKITDEELEREPGGSGLRYSFDIANGQVTQEVGVDAASGRVLENKAEGAD
ncbi:MULTISPECIES: PepSY domain-containing protein [Rhodopseudomonas]|uniref:Peptidase M4 n=1 Tax=Rhodopseudomonas palustris TaxID=1076 RepID=A0A0D7F4G9_RHOPL|nr:MULTISPECIES: PepSY domain-containing protein [Rhodopseudomonas]KIZ47695.1 peptidase M4 [Rhodopseudomonas palustris]MDF3813339.1 PepSY domain-containing protein [Rhodopseudomonas sp. BAL398]WOK17196.1 PepSY domain-containing protein [Rhodopseudomonas sp. BAL398]